MGFRVGFAAMSEREVTAIERREMARIVNETLGKKAALWWKTPNPNFRNVSPMWMAVGGRTEGS